MFDVFIKNLGKSELLYWSQFIVIHQLMEITEKYGKFLSFAFTVNIQKIKFHSICIKIIYLVDPQFGEIVIKFRTLPPLLHSLT